jgi:ribosomal protein S18 acetylase RimI-like enzyme
MIDLDRLVFRPARATDAEAIAVLHADSWRRNYRGAYSDAFLDGDVYDDRRAVWSDRLDEAREGCQTIVAKSDDAIVGFAHTIVDEDPAWGALLENLHVAFGYQRCGIGARLLGLSARAVIENSPGAGLYLWVLEQNVAAQAFYQSLGGKPADRADVQPPGGVGSRLNGSSIRLRYAWPDPSVLFPTG